MPIVPFPEPSSSDASPQGWSETLAEFYARSTTPVAVEARHRMNRWLAAMPLEYATEAVERLRAKDDRQHFGALWELGLAAAFVDARFGVEPHPVMPSSARRPDFRVTSPDGRVLFVEATTAGPSDDDFAAERRRGQFYDALNPIESPDHFLDVRLDVEGPETPTARRIRPQVRRVLDGWPHAELATLAVNDLPQGGVTDGRWAATIRPIPKRVEPGRGAGHRAIGSIGPEALADPTPCLRAALERKASAYGRLAAPYVVAVNVLSLMTDDLLVVSAALFGSPAVAFAHDGSGTTREFREPDGFWWSGRPTNQNVAAVIVAFGFGQRTSDATSAIVWPNPYLDPALDTDSLPFPSMEAIRRSAGV